ARLGRRERGELVQRRARAVVVDVHALEERRRGAAGAHVGQLLLERGVRLVELGLQAFEHLGGHGSRPPWTSVPIRSPTTARLMFPDCSMLKTRIGRPLSMQSDTAVESITCRWRLSTSM